MPKKIMNYENTFIYKICCKDVTITEVYVGHTTNFKQRKSGHKLNCNNEKNKNYNCFVYKFIREHGGWYNWDMVLIENINCKCRLEALQQERYYVEILNASLNSISSSITKNIKNKPIYTCDKCNYTTNQKQNIFKHQNKENYCKTEIIMLNHHDKQEEIDKLYEIIKELNESINDLELANQELKKANQELKKEYIMITKKNLYLKKTN